MATVIDVWTNCSGVRPGRMRLPEAERVFARSGNSRALEENRSPHDIVAEMDQAGVDVILMSAWSRPEGWIFTNEDVARFTHAYPSRIKGVAAVDLMNPTQAVQELRRAVRDYGFVGLRVVPWLWGATPKRQALLSIVC